MRRQGRGFTLIEMLVVIFILAVGLTSVSALFVAGVISSRKAEHTSAAVNAARRELERMRGSGFAACTVNSPIFPAAEDYQVLTDNGDGTGELSFPVANLPHAQGRILLAYYDSPSGVYPNLKDITVTVTWTGGARTGGRVSLRTFIGNHP